MEELCENLLDFFKNFSALLPVMYLLQFIGANVGFGQYVPPSMMLLGCFIVSLAATRIKLTYKRFKALKGKYT